jgi:Domain of Unknown Function (DUF1080)
MGIKNFFYVGCLALFLSNCSGNKTDNKWETLFNGKDLTGWDTYLGPRFDTLTRKWDKVPVGLNIDPLKVFSVTNVDGQPALRISGQNFGGISTKEEFENYHLQLQFKWGVLQWPPNNKGKKDGGLMYDGVGPQGADGGFWLRSHEFQIEQGDCGDYWACAGATADVTSVKLNDSTYQFSPKANLITFSTASTNGRYCVKGSDGEKPTGEWNTLDLYCVGGTSVHVVNGVVNMILQNSRQPGNGKEIPLVKGKIQFESEGSEMFCRNIKVQHIQKIPDELMK